MCGTTLLSTEDFIHFVEATSFDDEITFTTLRGNKVNTKVPSYQSDGHMKLTNDKNVKFTEEFIELAKNSPNGLFVSDGNKGYHYVWTKDSGSKTFRLIQAVFNSNSCYYPKTLFRVGYAGEVVKTSENRRNIEVSIHGAIIRYSKVRDSSGRTKQRATNITIGSDKKEVMNIMNGPLEPSNWSVFSPIPYQYPENFYNPQYYTYQPFVQYQNVSYYNPYGNVFYNWSTPVDSWICYRWYC